MEDCIYNDELHLYTVGGEPIPSLTGMISADGQCDDLKAVPPNVLAAKAQYGSDLHKALELTDSGWDADAKWVHHIDGWLNLSARMKWGKWEIIEKPCFAFFNGFAYGFTPDRSTWGKAVVELKTSYSKHAWHGIQTALQVIGLAYSRKTPRYVVYFDKTGLRHMTTCDNAGDFDEAERIIFEQAKPIDELPEGIQILLGKGNHE